MGKKIENRKKIAIAALLIFSVGVLNSQFNSLKNRYEISSLQIEYNHEEVLAVESESLTTEDMDTLFADYNFEEVEEVTEKIIENIQYTVKKGDTISTLAKKYNTNIDYLIANNMDIDLNILKIGKEIKIPSDKGFFYKVESKDSFSILEKKFNISETAIKEDNNVEELIAGKTIFLREPKLAADFKSKIITFKKLSEKKTVQNLSLSEKFYNPLNKITITSSFGNRTHPVLKKVIPHGAVDLKAAVGTKVMAARDGVVKFAGYSGNYGYLVVITHKNGFETRYAHLSKISVKAGQKVTSKDVIALSGQSGRVSGPHLHYEVRKNGKVLNPITYMVLNK